MDATETYSVRVAAALDPRLRERFNELYAQLHRLAHRELSGNRSTLCTTGLVHEAYLKLHHRALDLESPAGLLALAGKAMRCVVIDNARARSAQKRGGDRVQVSLLSNLAGDDRGGHDLMDIERALQALEALDPRLVEVVECRFFAGMEFDEVATHLGISRSTVNRDWRRARAFLETQMRQGSAE